MNMGLYLTAVLIWGTTWIALTWQIGEVDIVVSIFYRFALASAMFLPLLVVFGKLQTTNSKDHLYFFLQGACLFSFNFICFYHATHYIISGLLPVVFALASLFNAFNQWLIWRERPATSIYVAGILGVVGLVFLCWPQWQVSQSFEDILYGILFSMAGTYFFSLGNMVTVRHTQQGIRPWTGTAYGMIYGTLILLAVILVRGLPWNWDEHPIYLGSLIYLTIFGTIIGFTVYLLLVSRMGANKAAYVTVLSPVIALIISTFFEGYQWDFIAVSGLLMVLLGALISSQPHQMLALWRRCSMA